MINENIGTYNQNLVYLYGLSDYWTTIFQDDELINTALEASSFQYADVYSTFLQLASSYSLEDIQQTLHSDVVLEVLTASETESLTKNTFTLSAPVLNCEVITDRPFLPTQVLVKGVDFEISEDGLSLSFARPISSYKFAVRRSDADEFDYSIWLGQVEIDVSLLPSHFGVLLGLTPQTASERLKNLTQGLYYISATGPTISNISIGAHLALGIPVTRQDGEEVIDIRMDLETGNQVVTTTVESYLIPYGLKTSYAIGDIIERRAPVAEWVKVSDYQNDNTWWYDLHIPSNLIPVLPEGVTSRHAVQGGVLDGIMRDYLKNHSFLISVNAIQVEDTECLNNFNVILKRIKPAWSYAVYVWEIPTITDTTEALDEASTIPTEFQVSDLDFGQFNRRGNKYGRRGNPFIRSALSKNMLTELGFYDEPTTVTLESGTVCSGFLGKGLALIQKGDEIGPKVRDQASWASTLMSGSYPAFHPTRDKVLFVNTIPRTKFESQTRPLNDTIGTFTLGKSRVGTYTVNQEVADHTGIGVNVQFKYLKLTGFEYGIPLHGTSTHEVLTRVTPPEGTIDLFHIKLKKWVPNNAIVGSSGIGVEPEIGGDPIYRFDVPTIVLDSWNPALFTKALQDKVDVVQPELAYIETDFSSLGVDLDNDFGYLAFKNLFNRTWVCYWVTRDLTLDAPLGVIYEDDDSVKLELPPTPVNRSSARNKSSLLFARGYDSSYTDKINTNIPVGDRSSGIGSPAVTVEA